LPGSLSLRCRLSTAGDLPVGGAQRPTTAQQSLSNPFAGMVLVFAKPVRVGDRVSIRSGALGGEFCGDVTEIGITYITLNTSDGPERLPNSQVLAAALCPESRA
jgi:small conductance mechanosensitive channel